MDHRPPCLRPHRGHHPSGFIAVEERRIALLTTCFRPRTAAAGFCSTTWGKGNWLMSAHALDDLIESRPDAVECFGHRFGVPEGRGEKFRPLLQD
jgi:hypothetical protein